ncbi:uncharacterized protein LOC135849016 isoform X2 [Planococcus citri]|uniref:uncharacterized protein LOC135849016 isoform X2 n=1 Tax=Planococcus citri TaxID=170843 RepID=UPI0031F8DC53
MLPIITCLTLLSVIYIVHVQADEQDDPIDSNIFSSSEKQELKIFQGHQRWLHKKALRQLKEKEATSFFSYFCCAVDHCRGVMELNHKFTELYLNLYHTRVTPQDLPEDFQHLNDTCDEWLDVVFYRKNPKNKKPPRQKIKSAYLDAKIRNCHSMKYYLN